MKNALHVFCGLTKKILRTAANRESINAKLFRLLRKTFAKHLHLHIAVAGCRSPW